MPFLRRRKAAIDETVQGATAPSTERILWVTVGHGVYLWNCEVLSDYDAVVIDQTLRIVADDPQVQVAEGGAVPLPDMVVGGIREMLRRRHVEMLDLLANGGMVIVRLRLPNAIFVEPKSWSTSQPPVLSWDIWVSLVDYLRALHERQIKIVEEGAGRSVTVEEPGHALADYLRTARYSAVLTPFIRNVENASILATNRAGVPIAVEIRLEDGLLLLLPSDGDSTALENGVLSLVELRRAHREHWQVTAESELLDQLQQIENDVRTRRLLILDQLQEVWATKRRVMESDAVKRVLEYHRLALRGGTGRTAALTYLFKMVEIIEDTYGGENQMIAALNLSKSTVKALKGPSNRPQADVRHATVGAVTPISDSEFSRALKAADVLVSVFVEDLYRRERDSN